MKTGEQIKKECEYCYTVIKAANEQLEKLRKECKHEKFFIGNYEWAAGHVIRDTKICEYCNIPLSLNDSIISHDSALESELAEQDIKTDFIDETDNSPYKIIFNNRTYIRE